MEMHEFPSKNSKTLLRGRFIKATNTNNSLSPVVIMLTGDGKKGSKSLSWVNMPPKLQEAGISSFLFDFEGLGYSEGERRNLSLSVGVDNFISAYEFVKQQEWVDIQRIGAFASSFGATVLLLTPNIANQLKAIGLKSPAAFIPDAYFREIGAEKFEEWRTNGYLEENGYNYDILMDSLKYNVFCSSTEIDTPCMITQGDNDEIIALQHTFYLFDCLRSKDKFIEVFEKVSHGYSENDAWERMANIFLKWFRERL
jgi:hypothetical protein